MHFSFSTYFLLLVTVQLIFRKHSLSKNIRIQAFMWPLHPCMCDLHATPRHDLCPEQLFLALQIGRGAASLLLFLYFLT